MDMAWREDDFGAGGGQGYGGPSMDEIVLKIQQKMARGSGYIWRLWIKSCPGERNIFYLRRGKARF